MSEEEIIEACGNLKNPIEVNNFSDLEKIGFNNFIRINGNLEFLYKPSLIVDFETVKDFGGYLTVSASEDEEVFYSKHYSDKNLLKFDSIRVVDRFRENAAFYNYFKNLFKEAKNG